MRLKACAARRVSAGPVSASGGASRSLPNVSAACANRCSGLVAWRTATIASALTITSVTSSWVIKSLGSAGGVSLSFCSAILTHWPSASRTSKLRGLPPPAACPMPPPRIPMPAPVERISRSLPRRAPSVARICPRGTFAETWSSSISATRRSLDCSAAAVAARRAGVSASSRRTASARRSEKLSPRACATTVARSPHCSQTLVSCAASKPASRISAIRANRLEAKARKTLLHHGQAPRAWTVDAST